MYEYFSHPSDIGVRGIGKNLMEAFSETAKGMFSLIADLKHFSTELVTQMECSAIDIEFLLINFLNKLLLEASVEKAIFCEFNITEMSENYLKAEIKGEKIKNTQKDLMKIEVKAATPCELKVEKQGELYIAQCVLDV